MTQGKQMFEQSLRDLPWILPIVRTQELVFWLMITYIALFSALLSRLTALAYDSTWVTGFLQRVFWISTEVVCLSTKAADREMFSMAGATWNCCRFGESSVYTIQSCTMSLHAKPHTLGVCVFSCNLPPALLAEWPGSFTCYCGNTGVMDAEINNICVPCFYADFLYRF